MHGPPLRPRVFRTMRREVGARKNPTNCSRGMGVRGERSGKTIRHLSRVKFRRRWGERQQGRTETMTTETATTNREIRILTDANAITQTAAAEFLEAAKEAVREKGSFTVALSGGSTPKTLYGLLISNPVLQAMVPWSKTQFFFGDERHVPPNDTESNFRMATEAMFAKAPVDAKQVHRIKGEKRNAAQAAEEYEEDLQASFRLAEGELPRLDLVLLGMGPEGHTASLFPGTDAIREKEKLPVAPWVEKFKSFRVSLTPPGFNNSAEVVFLVAGDDKAETLERVLEGPEDPDRLPAQTIRPA